MTIAADNSTATGRPADASGSVGVGPTPSEWLSVYLATWAVMLTPILAAHQVFPDRRFTMQVVVISTVALALSVPLRRSRLSRLTVNAFTVTLCAVTGWLEFGGWRAGLFMRDWGIWVAGVQETDTMGLLVRAFIWIMAFRALTVRTQRDLALTTVPSLSALVLIAVLRADLGAVLWFAAFLLAAFWLFAVERSTDLREHAIGHTQALPGVRSPGQASLGALLGTYALSVTGGVLVCIVLMQFTLPRELAGRLRLELAQRVAQWLIQSTRRVYTAPSPRVDLRAPAPPLSNKVLFYVNCDQDLLWRLEAYDEYDGRFWSRRQKHHVIVRPASGFADVPPEPDGPTQAAARGTNIRQVFEVEAPLQGAVVAAYRPLRLLGVGTRLDVDDLGDIRTTSTLVRGDHYVVVSHVNPAYAGELGTHALPAHVTANYLRVPDSVSPEVRALARQIALGRTDPYRVCKAIEAHLAQSCRYDLRAGPPPRGQDPLDYFLFESRRGYCNHFATAMTILCRLAGVPARLAVGYRPGEIVDGLTRHAVRESDGHSWTEAYIAGAGWITFDPTEGAVEAHPGGLGALLERISLWWRGLAQRFPLLARKSLQSLLVAATLLLSLLLAALGLRRIARAHVSGHLRPSADDARGRVVLAYRGACAALAWAGFPKPPSATPLEFVALGRSRLTDRASPLEDLTRHYVHAVYRNVALPLQAATAAERSARTLRLTALRLRTHRLLRRLPPP